MSTTTKGKLVAAAPQTRTRRLRLRAAAVFAVVFLLGTGAAQRAQGQTLTVLHSFTDSDGANPFGGLVTDAAGNLYGTTESGGAYHSGTLFKLDTAGRETVLRYFAGKDGAGPYGGLLMDKAGKPLRHYPIRRLLRQLYGRARPMLWRDRVQGRRFR
jgi:uncharacterized repeat protein (TIGR03803 family)